MGEYRPSDSSWDKHWDYRQRDPWRNGEGGYIDLNTPFSYSNGFLRMHFKGKKLKCCLETPLVYEDGIEHGIPCSGDGELANLRLDIVGRMFHATYFWIEIQGKIERFQQPLFLPEAYVPSYIHGSPF